MSALALKPALKTVDLSAANGPTNATVVIVPFPKNTVGVVFGQRTALWAQRFNTYLLDTNNIVMDPQVVWDATSNGRFDVTNVVPQSFLPPDKNVFSYSPANVDRNIAVYCSHKGPGDTSFKQSDPHHSFQEFKIGTKNAISFTMVNAEDGGDTDFHDTVVGVAVA